MNELSVMGLDLSLSGTGACFVDFREQFMVTLPLRLSPYDKKFKGVYNRIAYIKSALKNYFADFDPDLICVETALPKGQWAAGSFGLCVSILDWVCEEMTSGVYLYHPTYMDFIHKMKSHKKSMSVSLANTIIDIENLNHHISHRMNHDEAEAFLFAYGGSIQAGRKPKVTYERFMVEKADVLREIKIEEGKFG